ncbi:MAG TPA: UDP-N-acetylmuramoyl-L-alanine--D-glutamate ligase [Tepidiformaceae bacterium]|nr:UDP-N-acetylmuramoyl-L-alanine--D-glutamate ligase [Tepidiformaceae bacterium]
MATQNGNGLGFDPDELRGKRVLVYSLGIEGRDLARFMVRHGATVTVSDTRSAAQLQAAGAALPDGVTDLVSGRPLLDPEGFDLVAVSQSVLRGNPALGRARSLGVPMTSQMRLFLQLCPGKTVGITGSSGKSTTTALVGAMAAAGGLDYVVGGNLGEALLGRLDDITAETTVILEISHTQLQYTDRSPHIAAITNVTPNHLDQFSWDEYVGLKRNILTHQTRDDIAILNADDHSSSALAGSVAGRLVRTSIAKEPAGDAVWLDGDRIVARRDGHVAEIARRQQIRLRGRHNVANVVMACALGNEAGIAPEAVRSAVAAFRGVAHRLEIVGTSDSVTWVNDSIATSPERTMAGLESFTEPVVLLLGGRDKNLPLDGLRELARGRCRAVICFGEAGPLFHEALRGAVPTTSIVSTLEEAVAAAAAFAVPGDVVLLAPAGTSFDAYPSFEVRGEAFRRLVRALPGFNGEVPS